MADDDGLEQAYGAPLTDRDEPAFVDEARDEERGLRTAGALLVLSTMLDLPFAIASNLLRPAPVSSMGALVVIAAFGVGAGLWLRGKPFRLPTLAYLIVDVTLPMLKSLALRGGWSRGLLIGTASSRLLRALPVLLLLIGRPSRRRTRAAIALFVLIESLATVGRVGAVYWLYVGLQRFGR